MPTSPALATPTPDTGTAPWSQTAPLFVVLNGGSGHVETQERVATVKRVFQEAGRRHELLEVSDPKNLPQAISRAIELARQHHGAVVAAGGDGTINAVVQQVLPTGLPLGILPQGTFNYFGRNHGISSDMEEAARSLFTATLKPVQVGLINDKAFIVNASMGLYPTLLQDREAFKQRFGRSRVVALFASLATLWRDHRDWVIKLTLDDTTHTIVTPTLFVGNNALQMQQIGIPEAPALQDGQLVAIAVKPVGKLAMLGLLARGAIGQLGDADKVSSFAFSSLTVSPRRPHRPKRLKVATDGEVIWMDAPLHFRPAPRPLLLLVPT